MRVRRSTQLLFIACIIFTASCSSQLTRYETAIREGDPAYLTLERLFSSTEFRLDSFRQARWLKENRGYTTLDTSATIEGGEDIVRYDPVSGEREILVPAERFIPQGDSTALDISGYQWSEDSRKVLIFTNTKRVWRANTRGDYWVLNLDTWKLQKLGGDAEPSTLMFAKFSPDGTRAGYVRQNNIFVELLENGRIEQLTRDGSDLVINGTFDWVYEEELGLRDGFRWSPDSRSIAYWQLDSEGVGEFYLINNTDSLYPQITTIPYPKVGETNSAARIGVISADGGNTIWMQIPGDSRNNYLARMDWADNSNELIIQQLNRRQNTNSLFYCDASTGIVHKAFVETDEAWVDMHNEFQYLDDGDYFLWMSERDGWRHAYRVSRDGQDIMLLTPGDFDVVSVENVDEENGWLYYVAAPENPTRRYLFRNRLDGTGEAERITPEGKPGTHSYRISPNAEWAFHTYSRFGTPPVTELISLPEHQLVRLLADNREIREKIEDLKRGAVEFFRVGIGEVELDGWIMKPPNFNPGRSYPVLLYVYGEPAGTTVQDSWGGRRYLWHLMLTQRGYLVMSIDNRGTRAPRGREWRKVVYRKIGSLASVDQAAAMREFLRQHPFADGDRIAVWGWSGGGSMSLNLIFRYPDLYHTAMSVAPNPDQHLYDTIYQERYMGLPMDNEDDYIKGSPITYAPQLEGNLLVVHGTGDDNGHYQGTEKLINELIKHNKPFTMMAYPNRSHGISEGKNTSRHLYELLTRFLTEKMPPD